ncbi:Endoribonuclease Dicer-like 2a [Symbiodinium microadriaticum]|uniref:Endoribonuclease Dicer-like 2a n=1 Tax=Symbiodinium microadriaticum TaxID=2951 RepID=A0A1Q9EU77_SYMMI|nr:Endoribonuclease Dicer-like 2a [Symbiodinium microadriaticum]
MELRAYQARLLEEILASGNTLVVLPTGAGKTLIASELIRRLGPPCLFLVPTCLLVEQQAKAVRDWTGLQVAEFMGGMSLPAHFDVLVSTPKAFQMTQSKGAAVFQWDAFKLVVFDEVHHVLKDHPYRRLALSLSKLQLGPQILGLSASLTYAVGEGKVQKDVTRICRELQIRHMATAGGEELATGGYHSKAAEPVLPAKLPSFVPEGVLPAAERKPHLMVRTFFDRLQRGMSTQFTKKLFSVVQCLETTVAAVDSGFKSPLQNPAPRTWGDYAHKRIPTCSKLASLEHWYEALRMLVTSWEEAEDAAVAYLQMVGEREPTAGLWPPVAEATLAQFWHEAGEYFPRFEHLKDALLYEHATLSRTHGSFRGILFVQQRIMTHVLEHVILTDGELVSKFKPACIYATSSPATASYSVSAADSKARLAQFADGSVNLLIATVVAEEGMDVPAANCVIRFDPMINSVSFVQGRGRARQEDSSFVVLSERPDRPTSSLAAVEAQQLEKIVRSFNPERVATDTRNETAAQRSRERNAREVLLTSDNASTNALAALNLYCKKTKVELQEEHSTDGKDFTCSLKYESVLRSVEATGSYGLKCRAAEGKKQAKRAAAAALLEKLSQQEP